MLAKDSVQVRLERGLSFTEFSYMLLQAYDFAHLYRTMGVELQMGGADQWGNITAGLELIRRTAGSGDDAEPAHGLAYKLLLSPSGTKFGKSESGDSVWLDPTRTSPYAFYQYWLNTDDRDVGTYLRWFTELPREAIEALDAELRAHPEARAASMPSRSTSPPGPTGRGGRAGGRRFGGQVLGGTDRRPGGARGAVRVGGRVHVPAGVAGGRGRDAAGGGRAPRVEGGGAPADRRRRRDDQRGTHHRRGDRSGADRRGVAGRPHRQATAGDRAARRAEPGRRATVRERGSGAVPLRRASMTAPATFALGEQDEQVVQQVRRFAGEGGLAAVRSVPAVSAAASSLAARRTSVASSVTLRAAASTPPSSSEVVYEPAGRSAARAAIVAHSVSSQAKPWRRARPAPRRGRSSCGCLDGRSARRDRP